VPVTLSAAALIDFATFQLAFPATGNDEQDRIHMLINQASARIESYTGRRLKSRTYAGASALVLDGTGTGVLILPHRPIVSITHLYVDSSRIFASDSEILAASFSVDSEAGMIRLYSGSFPDALDAIKIECVAGFATTHEAFPVLETACLELVKWMQSRYAGFIGKRTETNADGLNIGFEIDIPSNVKAMVDPFREVRA